MSVTPQMVKELRERTGAGMADCKKALDNCSGDMEKSIQFLREKGLAAAAKKASRAASEGQVTSVMIGSSEGYLVEVNCETDFVTRNESFQGLVKEVEKLVASKHPNSLDDLLATTTSKGISLKDDVTQLVATIGENVQVRRFAKVADPKTYVTSYVHMGGKVGVLVQLFAEGISAKAGDAQLQEAAKDVALQVAAMKPQFVNREKVSQEALKAEEEVYYQQYRNQGKPEAMLPKIVAGRIQSWYKEACLVDQPFVKDDSKSVAQMVTEVGKKIGLPELKVVHFERMELGQGVEKKSMDFAAEVAAQIASVHA